MNHIFIGFGNLAKAIYQGLQNGNSLRFAYYARQKKDTPLHFFSNLPEAISWADIVWLTIKPQDLPGVLHSLQPLPLSNKLVVSPVAGKKIEMIIKYLGNNQPVVRIMPNLAIAYQKSVTSFAANQPEDTKTQELLRVLSKLGKVVELEEESFDLFTSVFGSGPAFILSFIQIFKEKMREFNLPGTVLDELLLQLTQGTTTYFEQNQKEHSIEELIKNITSKGGTTQAGLDYYQQHEIGKRFEGVLEAAKNRSFEMGRD